MSQCLFVFVVDDDELVCELLLDLLWEFGFVVKVFLFVEMFFVFGDVEVMWCFIFDIVMFGMCGLEF